MLIEKERNVKKIAQELKKFLEEFTNSLWKNKKNLGSHVQSEKSAPGGKKKRKLREKKEDSMGTMLKRKID